MRFITPIETKATLCECAAKTQWRFQNIAGEAIKVCKYSAIWLSKSGKIKGRRITGGLSIERLFAIFYVAVWHVQPVAFAFLPAFAPILKEWPACFCFPAF